MAERISIVDLNRFVNRTASRLVKFHECETLGDGVIGSDQHVNIENGLILNDEQLFFDQKRQADLIIDCNGAILTPGFIDVQINGGWGIDFSTPVESAKLSEDLRKVSFELLKHGVTSFCPTVISSSMESYPKIMNGLQPASFKDKMNLGADNLGIHLEGPFINSLKRGAHPEKNLFSDLKKLHSIYGENLKGVKLVTLAPELDNACYAIEQLVNKGITVSVGHSCASLSQGEEAVRHGARMITHLFNAMLPFHHRDPGLMGLLTSNKVEPPFYGIIADGIHTDDAALRIAYRTHPRGFVLISDAIAALGLADGTHRLGDQVVRVTGRKATIMKPNSPDTKPDVETLSGSVSSLGDCVIHLRKALLGLYDAKSALDCANLHPAQMLRIDNSKGTLRPGADADLVLLSQEFEVLATFVKGQLAFCADDIDLHVKKK